MCVVEDEVNWSLIAVGAMRYTMPYAMAHHGDLYTASHHHTATLHGISIILPFTQFNVAYTKKFHHIPLQMLFKDFKRTVVGVCVGIQIQYELCLCVHTDRA